MCRFAYDTAVSPTVLWDIVRHLCRELYVNAERMRCTASRVVALERDTLCRAVTTVIDMLYTHAYDIFPLAQWGPCAMHVPFQLHCAPMLKNFARMQVYREFVLNGVAPATAIEIICNLHSVQPRNINKTRPSERVRHELAGLTGVYDVALGAIYSV